MAGKRPKFCNRSYFFDLAILCEAFPRHAGDPNLNDWESDGSKSKIANQTESWTALSHNTTWCCVSVRLHSRRRFLYGDIPTEPRVPLDLYKIVPHNKVVSYKQSHKFQKSSLFPSSGFKERLTCLIQGEKTSLLLMKMENSCTVWCDEPSDTAGARLAQDRGRHWDGFFTQIILQPRHFQSTILLKCILIRLQLCSSGNHRENIPEVMSWNTLGNFC